MGNVVADGDGNVEMTERFDSFTLVGEHTVIGRAVILHAAADEGSQPSGNAGPRIACGVIEASPEEAP
jgi:Cu-Zn family superoxide dismutase